MRRFSHYSDKRLKAVAVLMAAMFLLVSCSSLREDRSVNEIGYRKDDVESSGYLSFYPNIYSFDSITGQVVSYSRELKLSSWEESPLVLVREFIETFASIGFGNLTDSFSVDNITFSTDVANIYLSSGLYITDEQLFYISTLLSNTMIRNFDISYCNVILGGRRLTVMDRDLGLFEMRTGILSEEFGKIKSKMEGLEDTEKNLVNHAFYVVNEKDSLVTSEVRSIWVSKGSDIRKAAEILVELADTKNLSEGHDSPLNEMVFIYTIAYGSDELLSDFFKYSDGTFEIMNAQNLLKFDGDGGIKDEYLASLFFTLKEVIPDMERIAIHGASSTLIISERDVEDRLGKRRSIYLPSVDMDSLIRVERTVPWARSMSIDSVIGLISQGRKDGDPEKVVGAFTGGLSEKDILSVSYGKDCLIIDFSENFTDALSRLTDQGRFLMIYSIVNTICEIEPVKRVLFLKNGERITSVSGSRLDLFSPLMPNPGLSVG